MHAVMFFFLFKEFYRSSYNNSKKVRIIKEQLQYYKAFECKKRVEFVETKPACRRKSIEVCYLFVSLHHSQLETQWCVRSTSASTR